MGATSPGKPLGPPEAQDTPVVCSHGTLLRPTQPWVATWSQGVLNK